MTTIRPELPPLPDRLKNLPLDKRGYPVPWFVTWIDGEPEFRVITHEKVAQAHKMGLCWVCGGIIGSSRRAFVIGPMCAVNRVSAEPGSHVDCATYAAIACPFLTRPHMKRRTNDLPEDGAFNPSHIDRNPGATLLWVTKRYGTFVDNGQLLFRVGDPEWVRWFAEGREATREEVLMSIDSGMPILRGVAETDGPKAMAQLEGLYQAALPLVPA